MKYIAFFSIIFSVPFLAGCFNEVEKSPNSVSMGKAIYLRECSECHGAQGLGAGDVALGLGIPAPDLTGLTTRNDGVFPREFIRRFILGSIERENPDAAMPDFGTVGLRHAYANESLNAEALKVDIDEVLNFLETIQQ